MKIENLRSPYETVRGMVYFPRMIDKIRLHAAQTLPPEYVENLGTGFDGRCCLFLRVSYPEFTNQVVSSPNLTEEQLLDWCFQNGRALDQNDLDIWNEFMIKRGWHDSGQERLLFRLKEAGFPNDGKILTFFDYIDHDEQRPMRVPRF